jgi:hypothetical protein
MIAATRLTLAAIALAASVSIVSAQTPQDHEAHHPADQSAQSQPQRPMGRGPTRPGTMPMRPDGGPGMMMGGDMSQMMGMMQMLRMMQGGNMPMGMGPAGRPLQHIEGQIAYYKAELKITDAQAPLWNAFADALRGSAKRLQEAVAKNMQANEALTAPEQMDRWIAMLTAQVDAMQTVLAAAKQLYAALSDDQKKNADELTAEHFMGMRGGAL